MIVAPFSYLGPSAFIVRPDPYSGFVKVAVPGTQFGNTFNQQFFYSDIAPFVNSSAANVPLIATASGGSNLLLISASVVTSGSTYEFRNDGYQTSIYQEDAGTLGPVPSAIVSPGASNFVYECWVFQNERLYSPAAPFHKSIWRNTGGSNNFSIDLTFQAQNSPQFRMRIIFNGTQYFSAAVSSNLNAWYHAAWVRSGNNFYWYWAGNRITGPTAMSGTQTAVNMNLLGGDLGVNDGAKGSVQDIRVSIGTDRGYTGATIIPPNSIVTKG